jgi:putative pre-16S rRNA nuclease
MPIPSAGRIIAIDWGEVRFGLALSDEGQILASPLDTLVRRPGKRFPMPSFLAHLEQHHPIGILVGLPLTPDGDEGESARAAREVAEVVAGRTRLPVEMLDERMTTARAHREIHAQGGSARGRREEVDALAAAVLLQGFLDIRRGGAVRES